MRAQLAEEMNERREAARAAEVGRNSYLGAAAAVGGMGILGGLLDAVDTMENKELEWIVSFAAYGAIVLAVGCICCGMYTA
jgi:hypothetical protein